jgi:hypothetical protein
MNDCSSHFFLEIDSQRQIFRMSAPVFQGTARLPQSVAHFLSKPISDRPTLSLEKNKVVMLTEEIPFSWGPQPTLRQQFYRFTRRARQCRHLFSRLAQSEHLRNTDVLF